MISTYRPTTFARGLSGAALLAVLAVVTLTDAAPAGEPTTAAESTVQDRRHQAQTVADLRATGAAMFHWLAAQEHHGSAAAEEDPSHIDWRACPSISHAELSALLVPSQLAEVPSHDPWGHAYEFCLDRRASGDHGVLGARATGRDGRFEADEYPIGAFEADAVDRDLVWMDGYFATWPAPPEG